MNSGEVESVDLWLILKVSEPPTATARAAGVAEAVRMPHALLRGDRTRAGALQASLRASYTWIRHMSVLRPTSYVAKCASDPTLTFLSTGLRSTLQTPQTLRTRLACSSPCHSMQS